MTPVERTFDSFKVHWPERAYLYPPYSRAEAWVAKVQGEVQSGRVKLCVALISTWFKNQLKDEAEIIPLYDTSMFKNLGWYDRLGSMLVVWDKRN